MSYFYDNTGTYPPNTVYYPNMSLRPEFIVSGDGYNLVDPADISLSRIGNLAQAPGGVELIYTDVNGVQHNITDGGSGSGLETDYFYSTEAQTIAWGANIDFNTAGADNYGNLSYASGGVYTVTKTGLYEVTFVSNPFTESGTDAANIILYLVKTNTSPVTVLTSQNVGQVDDYFSYSIDGNYIGTLTVGDTIAVVNLSMFNETDQESIYLSPYSGFFAPYDTISGVNASLSFKYLNSGGSGGDTSDVTYITRTPDASVPNAQAISTMANVQVDSVLTVSNPVTGELAASTRIIDDTFLTGNHNLFFGSFSGNTSLTGSDNTGVGVGALQIDTIGGANVCVGNQTMPVNTSGGYNTAVGYETLRGIQTGASNVALGAQALRGSSGSISNNVAVGYQAGYIKAAGNYNVLLGYQANLGDTAANNTVVVGSNAYAYGDNSIVVGYSSRSNPTNNIVLGANSFVTGTGSIAIGNSLNVSANNVCNISSNYGVGPYMHLGVNDPSPDCCFSVQCPDASIPAAIELPQIATPSNNPRANNIMLYLKSDNKLYFLDSSGVEHQITSTP